MKTMTEGKPLSLILRFALPLMAESVLQQMYNLVDSVVVGQLVGKEALAAVGSTNILNFLLVSLFSGLSLGFTILVSQFVGARDSEKLQNAVDTAFITALVGALFVTVLGLVLTNPLLRLLNSPEGPVREMSAIYLRILFIGTLGTFGFNLNAGILQGLGDSVSSLKFLAVATVLNIVLDLVFVVVFGWGVAGVAWATIIAQTLSFLLGLLYLNKRLNLFSFVLKKIRFHFKIFSEALRIGLPSGIQNMLFSLGTMAIQRLVNSYGPAYMAGFGISNKIDSFVFLLIVSFGSAATTFTGQNVGAKKFDRVFKGFKTAQILSATIVIIASSLIVVFTPFLMSLFSPEPEVIQVGVELLSRIMPCYVLASIMFVANSVVRGTGESLMPFTASMVSFLIFRLPAIYALDYFFGRSEIGWGYGLGWAVGLMIILPYYFFGNWKKKRLQ